ncbi:DUF92 domain-containing protein [Histomonas meleagridis]|uniref:DUF92 domain-containing protein n=1 Tax=Histomonas meleagridis TaxID=135588 RepID=UPI003559DB57|nr:DUF92 domain-containing protein [Histomonas meleagridis]KAH0798542.1 DUF92 domain-containing protein [Histomonas meleagridis]
MKFHRAIVGDKILDTVGPTYYPIITIVTTLILCRFVYLRKSLTFSGCVATMFVGVSVFWNFGFGGYLILLVFFFTSTIFTKISKKQTQNIASGIQKKGGCRDHFQVLANGGIAAFLAIFYRFTGNPIFIALFGASIAESTADTWAGEIGIMSPGLPISIITLKSVQKGLSGGISKLGTIAAFVGSFLISIIWCFFYYNLCSHWFKDTLFISISGFIGCLVDSIFGDLFQVHYLVHGTNQITEHEFTNGVQNQYFKGVTWMNNDMVNFLSNLSSCACFLVLKFIF